MLFQWKRGLLALWLMHVSDSVILNWCFSLRTRSLFSIFLSIFLLHLLLEAAFKIQPRVPPDWEKGRIFDPRREGGKFLPGSSKRLSESFYFQRSRKPCPGSASVEPIGCWRRVQQSLLQPNPCLTAHASTRIWSSKDARVEANPWQCKRKARRG